MNRYLTLFIGAALTALIANPAFADSTAQAATASASGAASAPEAVAPPSAAAAPVSEPAATKEQVKIGYIDMAKIAAESKGGKAAAASLKTKSAKLRAKIEAKQKQLEKEKAAIEAKISSMPPKERAAKARDFQKQMEGYQKLVMASEKEMQQLQEKLTSDLYTTIKKAAASYAKSHGYTAVLEQKAVLYLTDTLEPVNLTAEISKLMNESPIK